MTPIFRAAKKPRILEIPKIWQYRQKKKKKKFWKPGKLNKKPLATLYILTMWVYTPPAIQQEGHGEVQAAAAEPPGEQPGPPAEAPRAAGATEEGAAENSQGRERSELISILELD